MGLALGCHFTEHSSSFFKAPQRERAVGILRETIAFANELHGFLNLIDKSSRDFGFAMWCPWDSHINGAGMRKDRTTGGRLASSRDASRDPAAPGYDNLLFELCIPMVAG